MNRQDIYRRNRSDEPLVSVIVPGYNHARFLRERIESILGQSHRNLELILLDDCSKDDSAEILREYGKREERVIAVEINKVNSGSPFRQWQKGLASAKGKYLWIAESDDSSDPEFLRRCVGTLEENPEAVLVFTGSEYLDKDSKIIERPPHDYDRWNEAPSYRKDGVAIFDGREYLRKTLCWDCTIYNASGVLIRRDAVTSDMLEESATMRNSGDWLFWIRLVSKGKIGRIFSTLNRMRLHGVNTTTLGNSDGRRWTEDARVIQYAAKATEYPILWKKARKGAFIYHLLYSPEIPKKTRQEIVDRACAVFGMTREQGLFWRRRYLGLQRHSWLRFLFSLPPLGPEPI